MTLEEKQLLLKDLCARLQYGVKVSIIAHNLDYEKDFGKTIIAELVGIHTAKDDDGIIHTCFITCYDEFKTQGNDIDTIKPYLRPMSSMTEKEKKEFQACHCVYELHPDFQPMMCNLANELNMFDWLNTHHFDYRGLIWKGLALEAPDGMYKTE